MAIDPVEATMRGVVFRALRPPRTKLKLPSSMPELPSAKMVYILSLFSYFIVVSGFIYDLIVEPPGIGSKQDPFTGAVRPVVFLPGRVNGQYIIEGLASGFMFILGGIGIVMLDLSTGGSDSSSKDEISSNRGGRKVKMVVAGTGVAFITIAYAMVMLFIRIKIPAYLH